MRLGQRLAEETLGHRGIAPRRQQEVDCLPEAIDARYRQVQTPLTLVYVSSTRQDPAHGRR